MAAIDKTYTDKYSDYEELLKWAKNRTFKCPNGIVFNVMDSIYAGWTEESFNNNELPVMNTSCSMDYFLIKYCPLEFVQNRLKKVYPEKYYNSVKNGTSEFDKFRKNNIGTKFKLIRIGSCSDHNTPWSFYNNRKKINPKFFVSVRDNTGEFIWYNEKYDKFVCTYELGDWTSSNAYCCKSLKALVRKIKKWELPKGSTVYVQGRYIGEEWQIKVK